jgi:hypothetical protein
MAHTKEAAIKDDAVMLGPRALRRKRAPEPFAQGVDSREWSTRDRHKAAHLLVEIRKCLAAQGIHTVHDLRIDPIVRKLWLKLIASNAVESLSLDEVGRQWQCLEGSRTTSLCGTAARSSTDREVVSAPGKALSTDLLDCDPSLWGTPASCSSS